MNETSDSGDDLLKRDFTGFEIIEIKRFYHKGEHYPALTPITNCARCRSFIDDPTRDISGGPMPDHMLDERDHNPLCRQCLHEDLDKALEAGILETLESKLGLSEENRDALKAFIETVFTDPEKILKLELLNSRVSELEKDLGIWKWVAGIALGLIGGIALSALALAVTSVVSS